LLTFVFRERLFSYFRFALMERLLSINRKSAYWRNVIGYNSGREFRLEEVAQNTTKLKLIKSIIWYQKTKYESWNLYAKLENNHR
jgi:hypothetical protein